MARTKDIRLKVTQDEHVLLEALRDRLCFDQTATALRWAVLALAGDQLALRRVVPHLRDFRMEMEKAYADALDQEGR